MVEVIEKVIDVMTGVVPSKEAVRYEVRALGRQKGFLEMFGPGAVRNSLTKEEFDSLKDKLDYNDFVEELAERAVAKAPSEKDFFKMLDDANVEKSVIFNEHYGTTLGLTPLPNQHLAEFVNRHKDRVIGIAGIDPWLGDMALVEIQHCIVELGLHGILYSPFKQRLYANDKKLYPIYALCAKLGVPVYIHSGINWWSRSLMDYGRPIHIDEVAADFPSLKIVAVHVGWPWINEAVFLAWRQPNVYLEISAHHPKFFTVAGSGWEMFLYFAGRTIQDKILFGSSYSIIGETVRNLVDEVKGLPINDKVKKKWLHDNALRLFPSCR